MVSAITSGGSRPACGVRPYATAWTELANGEDDVLSTVEVENGTSQINEYD